MWNDKIKKVVLMTKRIFLLALLLGATVATMAQRYVGGDISLLPSY